MTVKKSTEKRVPKSLASEEEQKKFAEMFGPELVITFPGLSGPIINPPTGTNEEEEK
mgnify:FL=1